MIINMLSESGLAKGQGVDTAFLKTVEAVRQAGVDVRVNSIRRSDLLHAQTVGPLVWLFFLLSTSPRVMTAHIVADSLRGSLVGSDRWLGIARWFFKFIYSRADVVIAVSPLVERHLLSEGVQARVVYIPNGVDRRQFCPNADLRQKYRHKLGLVGTDRVVVCAGQLQPRKGIETFVSVARSLPSYQFVWIGGQPFGKLTEGHAHVERLLEQDLPNVHVTGVVPFDEMPGYYNAGDVLLFPSWQENLPYAVIEAAACGLPLILRDIPEYQDTFAGYFWACREDDFGNALCSLLTDPKSYTQWQQRSYELAAKFDQQQTVTRIIDIYSQLLDS